MGVALGAMAVDAFDIPRGPIACPLEPLARAGVPAPRFGSRALYPELEAKAYLAHAAISPLNLAGRRHVEQLLSDTERGGALAFVPWSEQRSRLRKMFARLWSVPSEDVALTAGTSYGIRDLALGLPLKKGDEIVTFQGEFPANVLPFRLAAERAEAHLHFLPQPDPRSTETEARILEGIEQRLRFGARYISLSAVQFQTGYAMPLAAISALAKRFGAALLVDAIQAAGAIPLQATELDLDAVTVGAHKWLLGIEGAGALYIKRSFYKSLKPLTLGWSGLEGGEAFLFEGKGKLAYELPCRGSAEAFEGSTPNVAGFAALEAGLAICLALSPGAIFEHVQAYHDRLEPELIERGLVSLRAVDRARRSGLLSFDLPAGVPLVPFMRELRARGVIGSSPDGFVRFAPHFSNSVDEIGLVARAVTEALAATA
jgi:cysteine desulfurase / selenocysteine lyase